MPDRVEDARDELGVVRGARDQLARADAVVVARVELERAAEDRVADAGVGAARGCGSRSSGAAPPATASTRAERGDPARRPTRARARWWWTMPASIACRMRSGAAIAAPCQASPASDAPTIVQRSRRATRPEIAPARVHQAIIRTCQTAPIEERFPRPSVMGVINVTPDSFSDGGVHFTSSRR